MNKTFKILNITIINLFVFTILTSPILIPYSIFRTSLSIATSEEIDKIYLSNYKKYFLTTARSLYQGVPLRNVIQYNRKCFTSSDKYVYLPKSNSICIQDNYEFSVPVRFGKYGNRLDNFGDIPQPRIIVLGDSHAMGWGVADKDIFTSQINQAGFKAINLSVSSYSTARELLRLREWSNNNPSAYENVKSIIIQYGYNDYEENIVYLNEIDAFNNSIKVNKNQYLRVVETDNPFHLSFSKNVEIRHLMPATREVYKYIFSWINQKIFINSSKHKETRIRNHAEILFRLLNEFSDLLEKKKIIIFVSNGYGYLNKDISDQLSEYNNNNDFLKSISIQVMSTEETLLYPETNSYFALDDHISVLGHKRLGKSLVNRLQSKQSIN